MSTQEAARRARRLADVPPARDGDHNAFARAGRAILPAGWWPATVHVLVGMPLGVVAFSVVVTLIAVATSVVLAVPAAWALLWAVRVFSAAQRSRLRDLLGVDVAAPSQPDADTWLARLLARLRDPHPWRQVGYHLLSLPIGVSGYVVVALGWGTGLSMSTVVLYSRSLAEQWFFGLPIRHPAMLAAITAVGLLLLILTPRLALGMARMDIAAARALLGPNKQTAMKLRVETLERSRADVVDAADAERRRIERDLHDGTQQRLVSLAMNLGMARTQLAEAPEPARRAIAQAHDEAKQALAELRDFVRGLHPAVLDDRGLDAALSGLAARISLPVRLDIDVEPRCSATVEAVAYFVVSESLTNIVKHARASQIEVSVRRQGARLNIRISDDGRGGARIEAGGGLAGLASRAASVDGSLRLDSPAGAGTIVEVELPCESS